jgi:hypothetical protein
MEDVYLHPRSALHRTAPEFVAFQSLMRSEKRTYMSMVTSVDPACLVDVGRVIANLTGPLIEPQPIYSTRRDCVLAWFEVKYGMHGWPLPVHAGVTLTPDEHISHMGSVLVPSAHVFCGHHVDAVVQKWDHSNAYLMTAMGFFLDKHATCHTAAAQWQPPSLLSADVHPHLTERAAHFAVALLSGLVAPSFGELVPFYNCKPQMVARKEGRALQRLSDIVVALARAHIDSSISLRAKWQEDSTPPRSPGRVHCLAL